MSRFVSVCLIAITSCLMARAAVASEPASGADEIDPSAFAAEMGVGVKLSAEDLRKMEAEPLGSAKNPVRVKGPAGQQAYLSRLRCNDGQPAQFSRLGLAQEVSPFGYLMDIYQVSCSTESPMQVYMDMYHSLHKEDRAIPGLKMDSKTD